MNKTLDQLMSEAEECLVSHLYSESTIKRYKCRWNQFSQYCAREGIETPSRQDGENYLKERLGDGIRRSARITRCHPRCIRFLFNVQDGNGIQRANTRERYPIPSQFQDCHRQYTTYLESKHYAPATIMGRFHQSKRFLSWLGGRHVTKVPAITADDVLGYVESISWMRPQSVSDTLFILRGFLRFLCDHCCADRSLGNLFPVIRSKKDSVLPSVYSPEELSGLLASLKDEGPFSSSS